MIDKKDNINRIIYFLEENKNKIVKFWVTKNSVSQILSKYNIDQDSFSSKVAVKIIDYFIEVLQQKNPIGHCPVMNDFIDYMYEKKITVKDIFLICMGLRRAIFSLIVSVGEVEKDKEWIIEIFSELFDQNLSGVLEQYEKLIFQNHIKRLQTIIDLQDNAIFEIDKNKLIIANRSFYEMIDVSDQKDFMRIYPDIWNFIESVNCFDDLFKAKKYTEWIEKIISENNGKCEVELFNYSLNQKVQIEITIRSILENKIEEYAVVLRNITDSNTQMSTLVELIYTDDMTQVPNRRKFEEIITIYLKECNEENQPFFLFLIDIHNFNDISEELGRDIGDSILKRFATGILQHINSNNFFARIDGNRFVLLSKLESYENSEVLARKVLDELHSIAYSNGDRAKGNIAIVSCQPGDNIESMIDRADRVIQRIVDSGSDSIMDDKIILEEDRMIKSASKSFLARCQLLFEKDEPLEVVNYYLEVPIDSKGKILKIDDNHIYVQLRKVALHALCKNSEIYIKTEKKPHFKAYVKDLDKEKLWAKLGSFKPVLTSPLDRKHIRVKLLPTIEGILRKGKMQVLVEIETISVDSFSLSMVNMPDIKVKDSIEIDTVLRWDGRMENLTLSGYVSKIKKSGSNIIIDINLKHGKNIEDIVSPFIAHRQLEIIKQLRETIL